MCLLCRYRLPRIDNMPAILQDSGEKYLTRRTWSAEPTDHGSSCVWRRAVEALGDACEAQPPSESGRVILKRRDDASEATKLAQELVP